MCLLSNEKDRIIMKYRNNETRKVLSRIARYHPLDFFTTIIGLKGVKKQMWPIITEYMM